ncbi:rho GTPase-activating protein 9 [Neolamprologus brichardi]|uniref:rho GTPase-activating protein 9 n=1 Tax=Neolamprologus brichardi TaxID=32507 RepID=UPI0016439024|nr:rho GTPase-activating protein 9 [Neolamprologus brichardi]
MLSGSWRRSFGHQQPAAGSVANTRGMTVCGVPSGTVVLEAQYDYSYRGADGRQVCIREGERFILLKKTNADWWQVRRIGAASKAKPLYVPATYVTEVPIVPMPSPQRLTATASLNTNFRILPRVSLSPSATGATSNEQRQVNKLLYHSMENLNSNSAFQGLKNNTSLDRGHFPTLPLSGFTFASNSPTSSSGHLMVPGSQATSTAKTAPTNSRVVPTITRSQSSNNLPENLMENPYDEVGGGISSRTNHRIPKKSCSQWDVAGASGKNNHLQVGRVKKKQQKRKGEGICSTVFATSLSASLTSGTSKPGNSRPESSVDLRGAKLHWANELSSKKNVFKLRTVTGNEFLLQSETDSLIREWYSTIQNVIDRLIIPSSVLSHLRRRPALPLFILTTIPSHLLSCPTAECPTLTSSSSFSFPSSSSRFPPSAVPRSTSNLENTERKRVKTRLKKLILKRPPLQALQEKGLIKDQVFGCSLEMLCERERSTVPRFVRLCTEAVERRGLETDGIYRVSGNLAVIQKLRFLVNHERAVTTDGRYMFPAELVQEEKLNLDESEWEDIHVITGALKLFFRELPEPLVPYGFFTDIVETVKMSDYMDKIDRLKCLVLNMPPPNHDTLQFMCRHLKRVLENSETNRMTTQNIGIVFGPTLMRPERDNGNMAVNMVYQNQAVELILTEFDHIFGTRGLS